MTAYAIETAQERGQLFVRPGDQVYENQVVGVYSKAGDLKINVCKQKALTNMRAANKEVRTALDEARIMGLDDALEYIAEDELVEVTPQARRGVGVSGGERRSGVGHAALGCGRACIRARAWLSRNADARPRSGVELAPCLWPANRLRASPIIATPLLRSRSACARTQRRRASAAASADEREFTKLSCAGHITRAQRAACEAPAPHVHAQHGALLAAGAWGRHAFVPLPGVSAS